MRSSLPSLALLVTAVAAAAPRGTTGFVSVSESFRFRTIPSTTLLPPSPPLSLPPPPFLSPSSCVELHRISRAKLQSSVLAKATKGDDGGGGGGGGGGSDTVEKKTKEEGMKPITRASWYAVEAFGRAFGSKKGLSSSSLSSPSVIEVDTSRPPQSLNEALERIKIDNDRSYFLSGNVDALAYDERCVFADPFVSFEGRDRFVDNLSNLGSFITNYNARMIRYDVSDDGTEVRTKVMVKLELNLPWKPILAWPWGVSYTIDPNTFLITSHVESWDIEPWEGVKQIFRKPTVQIKSNR